MNNLFRFSETGKPFESYQEAQVKANQLNRSPNASHEVVAYHGDKGFILVNTASIQAESNLDSLYDTPTQTDRTIPNVSLKQSDTSLSEARDERLEPIAKTPVTVTPLAAHTVEPILENAPKKRRRRKRKKKAVNPDLAVEGNAQALTSVPVTTPTSKALPVENSAENDEDDKPMLLTDAIHLHRGSGAVKGSYSAVQQSTSIDTTNITEKVSENYAS